MILKIQYSSNSEAQLDAHWTRSMIQQISNEVCAQAGLKDFCNFGTFLDGDGILMIALSAHNPTARTICNVFARILRGTTEEIKLLKPTWLDRRRMEYVLQQLRLDQRNGYREIPLPENL